MLSDFSSSRNKVLLIPGPSAVGRDFLLQNLIDNADIVGKNIGLGRPIKIKVVTKITDRPGRSSELTKLCVSEEIFSNMLRDRNIIASYVLESNRKRYGYHKDAFSDTQEQEKYDIYVADASVYQVPAITDIAGCNCDIFTTALIASREFREENLRSRGSESFDEINKRLNLGDAHVAIALLMAKKQLEFRSYIDKNLSRYIEDFLSDISDKKAAQKIIDFTGSENNVIETLKKAINLEKKYIDDLFIRQEKVEAEENIVNTEFFKKGVEMFKKAISK